MSEIESTEYVTELKARAEMAEVELAVTRNGSRLALAEARIQVLTEALDMIARVTPVGSNGSRIAAAALNDDDDA
jgi:hypothetical protein